MNQRAYHVEQATGRSQWEAPGYENRGEGSSYYAGNATGPAASTGAAVGMAATSGAGEYGASHYDSSHVGYDKEKKKKSSNTGAMMAAGAGGLAVGAIGTAVIAHEIGPLFSFISILIFTSIVLTHWIHLDEHEEEEREEEFQELQEEYDNSGSGSDGGGDYSD